MQGPITKNKRTKYNKEIDLREATHLSERHIDLVPPWSTIRLIPTSTCKAHLTSLTAPHTVDEVRPQGIGLDSQPTFSSYILQEPL